MIVIKVAKWKNPCHNMPRIRLTSDNPEFIKRFKMDDRYTYACVICKPEDLADRMLFISEWASNELKDDCFFVIE